MRYGAWNFASLYAMFNTAFPLSFRMTLKTALSDKLDGQAANP